MLAVAMVVGFTLVVAVVTVLLVENLGFLEGMALAGNGGEKRCGSKEVEKFHGAGL